MINRKLIFVLLSFLSITIAVLCYQMYKFSFQPKIAYINAEKVFNEFNMTIELKNTLEVTIKSRNQILDSLLVTLKMADPKRVSTQSLAALEKDYLIKKSQFEQQNQELAEKYDKQVWLRIEQYIKSYGEKDKYDFIFSTNNNAAIYYASGTFDITKEVIEYMNNCYSNGFNSNEK